VVLIFYWFLLDVQPGAGIESARTICAWKRIFAGILDRDQERVHSTVGANEVGHSCGICSAIRMVFEVKKES
jgi:hypothetical protein